MIDTQYIILIAFVLIVIYFVYTKYKKSESFAPISKSFTSYDSVTKNDILPQYASTQPKDLLAHFGTLEKLTETMIKYNIPIKSIQDPSEYPKIATFLHYQSLPTK
jgi:hypothetical protein